jgi:MFS family permease
MIVLAPLGGRLAQARGPIRVVGVSLTVAIVCTFAYGVVPGLGLLLVVSVVHSIADSFTYPSTQVGAALGSPPEHQSSAQGLLGATGLLAGGVTGLLAGFVYEHFGRLVLFSGVALSMVVFLAIALGLGRRHLLGTSEMLGTDADVDPAAIVSGVPDLP